MDPTILDPTASCDVKTTNNMQQTRNSSASRWPEVKERNVKVEMPLGIDKGMHLRVLGQKGLKGIRC